MDDCGGSYPASRVIVSTTGRWIAYVASSFPGGGGASVHLVSCVVVLGRACLICPGVGDCVFLACSMFVSCLGVASGVLLSSSSSIGVGYASVACSSSSSSHHLARRACSFFIVPVCRFVLPGVVSSHRGGYRAAGVASHSPFFSFSYELGKTAQDWISRSSLSGVPTLLVPRLALPSRRASRAVSSLWCSPVAGVRSCGSARAASSVGGASFVCLAAWRGACPHHSPVVSSCFSPCVSFCRLVLRCPAGRIAWRACSSHRGLVVLVLRGGASVLVPCGVSFSRLVVASRWRVVIGDLPVAVALHACGSPGLRLVSRLVERGGFGFSFYLGGERMGGGSRPAIPVDCDCLFWFRREMGQCRSRHRRSSACFLSSYGCGAWGLCGVLIWLVVACFLSSAASLLPRVAHSIGDGRDGSRRGDCLLGYRHVAHCVSSMGVYNEYNVCDVYKRYKDTMIREYDGYMR